jgi:hypothetical protein
LLARDETILVDREDCRISGRPGHAGVAEQFAISVVQRRMQARGVADRDQACLPRRDHDPSGESVPTTTRSDTDLVTGG